MSNQRKIKLSQIENKQTLKIPREFTLPTNEVILRKESGYLIIELITKPSLLKVLAALPKLDENFPDEDVENCCSCFSRKLYTCNRKYPRFF